MIHYEKIFLTLLAIIFLSILTSCKTTERVIVYPVIITPEIPTEPTHEPWQFTSVDDNNQLISNNDARKVGKYILDLKEYGETLKLWLDYYITETSQLDDKLTK